MILAAEELEVDPDFTIGVAWAAASVGASFWSEHGDYQIEDVGRDLGERIARAVTWCVPEEWQSQREHLRELAEDGPVEAKIVVIARLIVLSVSRPDLAAVELAGKVMELATSIDALAVRVAMAGWPATAAAEA